LLLGVGESIVAPASLRWIRVNCPEQERGLMVGIYMAGTKIGPAAGAPLAAWLISRYGWRPMFLLIGLVPLIWLLPWKALVADDAPRERSAAVTPAVAFAPVLRSPALWGILLATFCYGCYLYFCMTWLPAYFVERRKFTLGLMGLYTMFSFSGMAIMTILSGWAADRLIRRGRDAVAVRRAFTIAGFLIASTEVFGGLSSSATVAVAFAIVSLTGLGLATANYFALTQTLFPRELIGRIAGIQNAASNLAGAVAPWLTGILIERTASYAAPMAAISGALIVGALCYVVLVKAGQRVNSPVPAA
jgi:MFS family permease